MTQSAEDIKLPDGVVTRPLSDSSKRYLTGISKYRSVEDISQEFVLTVRLRRVADGLERDVNDVYIDYSDTTGSDITATMRWQWREGNYACDCNRSLFFARATGEKDPLPQGCGDGAYKIVSPSWLSEVR